MHLHSETRVSAPLGDVFPFFADASNLQALTAPWLHFSMATPGPIEMRPGALIDYRLRRHGLPVRWRSHIPLFEPPLRFVDEQDRGPYRRWVHTHTFRESNRNDDPRARPAQTVVVDDVDFEVPIAWLTGSFVTRELLRIFTFRHGALLDIFKEPKPWPAPHVVVVR
jgi:ligand-binding SRPBCC domain-containing protein